MKQLAIVLALAPIVGGPATAQTRADQPLYRVTVVERTTKAINYQYRSGPTKIDFRGTVLLPHAHGDATVESKQGRTKIDLDLEEMPAPARFGREYLSYVLWAITPDGRPHNLGEIVPNHSDDADLEVTTDLQAFALIVTAEPYSAVRMPSDVVVLQNEVRPDTAGRIEQVSVKYGLMPRGHYVLEKPDERARSAEGGPKVSMSRYEELLALYQAQNAVAIAGSRDAGKYAPDVYGKAQQLLSEAQNLEQSKAGSKRVVQIAREAAQTAEDARILAERREQEQKLADAENARLRAEADARQAQADAEAERSRADAERAARERAEAEAALARERASSAAPRAGDPAPVRHIIVEHKADNSSQRNARLRLLNDLNRVAGTLDTPRGLVVTIPDTDFNGSALRASALDQVAGISRILANHPGMRVRVEGHTDNPNDGLLPGQRAQAVRDVLASRLPSVTVTAVGLGDSRPVVSNRTPEGRRQNRRVEIVISGEPIGSLAAWDSTYSVVPR